MLAAQTGINECFQDQRRLRIFGLYPLDQNPFRVPPLPLLHAQQDTFQGDVFHGPLKPSALLQVLLGPGLQAVLRASERLVELAAADCPGGKQMAPGIAGLNLKHLLEERMRLEKVVVLSRLLGRLE